MKQPHIDEQTQVADLPVSAVLQIERVNRYGCVPGLPDEELADPAELERQVYLAELGPVLLLPKQSAADHLRPAIGEDGRPDWGAFGTVDFGRVQPSFDGARLRAQQLREQVRDLVILARVLSDRIRHPQKWRLLKLVKTGLLDVDEIEDFDLWQLAKMVVRIKRLRDEIRRIEEARAKRARRAAEACFGPLDS